MTKENYLLLCNNCASILHDNIDSENIIGIPFLHVIKEHPSLLTKYENLFIESHSYNVINFLLQFIKTLARLIIGVFTENLEVNKLIKEHYDVIFISHLLNENQIKDLEDFYFHNLPSKLNSDNLKVLVILINNTNLKPQLISIKIGTSSFDKLILPKLTRFKAEYKIFRKMLYSAFSLIKQTKIKGDQLKKNILFKSAIESLKESSFFPFRIQKQLDEILDITSPKYLIITHEGHSWERMCFSAARKNNTNIFCIAYQHSIISKYQFSISLDLTKLYNPDLILTSGLVSFEKLSNTIGLNNIKLDILGSNRGKLYSDIFVNKKDITILVVPEGIEEECLKLFNFALEYSKENNNINFIFRLHPIIQLDNFIRKHKNFKNLPNNINFSTNSIQTDLNNSQIVLYRGSNIIIDAVLFGLMPIFLADDKNLSTDPLNFVDNSNWKKIIKNSSEFSKAISFYIANRSNEIIKIESQNYCKKIFTPLNYNILQKYIHA